MPDDRHGRERHHEQRNVRAEERVDAPRLGRGSGVGRPIGRSRLRALRGRDAVGAARRPRRPRRRAPRRDGRPPAHRGSRARTSRRRWRATSGTGRCSSGRTRRRAVNEGRADYVPVFLSDIPRLFESRRAPARRRVRQRDAARRPRLLLARHERRGDARRDPGREDGRRPAQPVDAADARRQLRPRRRHRPGRRGRRPAVRPRRPDDRRRRAADRRARRRARPGRGDAPARDRRDPVGDGAWR